MSARRDPGGQLEEQATEAASLTNNEAEQALLGALFIDNRVYNQITDIVHANDFGNAVHACIFEAIGKLIDRGQNANPVTLKGVFDQDEALVPVGGAKYLAQLAVSAVTIINAEHYARIIVDLAQRRAFVFALDAARQTALHISVDQTAENVIDQHRAQLGTIRRARNPVGTELLSLASWLTRDIPEPDFLLGELLSTTCRVELIGPTGLGKTNLLMTAGMAVADGCDFLHWRGCGRPHRVLFIDGEMSRRLAKKRLVDAARRHGRMPETFYYFNREDFPEFAPLNTEAGQKFIDALIDALGGVDLVIFDNVQALLSGDMKEEVPWQQILPWVRDLTRRNIGQIWAHHTGHDESHGYGTKTREWQLDTVILMERIERPEADVAFSVKFTKARERSPDNRSDFEPVVITLINDEWSSKSGEHVRTKQAAKDRALELLQDAIVREGVIPPANGHIPPNTYCITEGQWRRYCELGCISEGSPEANRKAFKRAADKLVKSGQVGKWELWVWAVQ
jgi:hypothetical protein